MNEQTPRRIVVLGHTGFIGRNLLAALQQAYPDSEVSGWSVQDGDVTDGEPDISLGEDCWLFHLAACKRQFGDSLESFDQNMAISGAVARWCRQDMPGRLIYFSSAAVYGVDMHNMAITETTAVVPRSYYGIAKYASECLLRKACADCPERLLILRPTTVYGPGDQGKTYGPSLFVHAAMTQEAIRLWGDCSELRDLIHLDDLVDLVVALVGEDANGVFNLATGNSKSFAYMYDLVEQLTGRSIQATRRDRTKAKVDNGYCMDRLYGLLPDYEFVSLADGIRRMIAEIGAQS